MELPDEPPSQKHIHRHRAFHERSRCRFVGLDCAAIIPDNLSQEPGLPPSVALVISQFSIASGHAVLRILEPAIKD